MAVFKKRQLIVEALMIWICIYVEVCLDGWNDAVDANDALLYFALFTVRISGARCGMQGHELTTVALAYCMIASIE